MKELVELFLTFAKIGALTFGGGLSMLPMLKYEIVGKRGWATEDEILDYYAVGQCTPGIIAVNTATFIGYKRKGVIGGIVSTLGMITPSILIILVIASLLRNFMSNTYVQAALEGVRAAVCALMLNTIIILCRKSILNMFCFLLFAAAFLLTFFLDVSSIWIVIGAGIIGLIVSGRKDKKTL